MSKKRTDYVVGLLSGRFSNKYPTLYDLEKMNSRKTSTQVKEEQGLHLQRLHIDRAIFQKTAEDKAILKEIKAFHKASLRSNGFNPKKRMNLSKPSMMCVTS